MEDPHDDVDPRYLQSVELTWEEIRHVMLTSYGFRLEKEELRECTYAATARSMMGTRYNCVFFTAFKDASKDC